MTERFTLDKDTEWWLVQDNTIKVNEFGYREDLTGEDEYRGLHQELTEEETVKLLNKLNDENIQLKNKLKFLNELNEPYGVIIGENIRLKQENKKLKDKIKKSDLHFSKNFIQKSVLTEWILSKMSYYEELVDKTDGYNNVSAKGHLDMLIKLKKFIEGFE